MVAEPGGCREEAGVAVVVEPALHEVEGIVRDPDQLRIALQPDPE